MGCFLLDENMTCSQKIVSEDYDDFIIEYNGDIDRLLEFYGEDCITIVDNRIAIVYVPRVGGETVVTNIPYATLPRLYGIMDSSNMEEIEVNRIRSTPAISLYGNGVIAAIIDTGIDYTNPLFINADGSSRILAIWDQSIESNNVYAGVDYGTVYTKTMINEALKSENPYDIVPSRDEEGHGTFMAGIVAGGIDIENDFYGVAPNADILVIKLKNAKNIIRNFYKISEGVLAFQENDIINGINYASMYANSERKPVSMCIGLGSNSG